MNKQTCLKIFERFAQLNAQPTTELKYRNEFELLISVILSAQATDISVNKATEALFKKANSPKKMCLLGEERLQSFIKSIGLYKTKAKNIIKTCHILVEHFQSQVPNDRTQLESLPGVGRKTANVILNTAFGHPTIAVDTHIFRVANRIGLANAKTPLEVEKQLMQVVPKPYLQNAHHWLILHGRYVCTARKPKCYQCPIENVCEYSNKTIEE